MIIYAHCGGCGERREIVGFGGAIGFQCAGCASHAPCHDCGRLYQRGALTDLGDGYETCEACQLEVVARAAAATAYAQEDRECL